MSFDAGASDGGLFNEPSCEVGDGFDFTPARSFMPTVGTVAGDATLRRIPSDDDIDERSTRVHRLTVAHHTDELTPAAAIGAPSPARRLRVRSGISARLEVFGAGRLNPVVGDRRGRDRR